MQHVIFLFLTLLSFFSYSQIPMEEFVNESYSIEYPRTWTVKENELGAELFILAPKSNATDIFNENVNLIVQDLSGTSIDLDAYVRLSEKQITEVIGGKIVRSERFKSGSLELHKIIYTGNINGFDLQLIQNYYVRDSKAYILSFTAEQSSYEPYRKIGTQMLQSFRFKK